MFKQTDYKIIQIEQLQYQQKYPTKDIRGQDSWNRGGRKNLLAYEENSKATHPAFFDNGFLSAFLYAYNSRGDVKITPDDVWIIFLMNFSKYVNQHLQQLRHLIHHRNGKRRLLVLAEFQETDPKWSELYPNIVEELKKNVQERVSQSISCSFTTTKIVEKIISSASVLSTYEQSYSHDKIIAQGGINNIHLGGTLEDWRKLITKVQKLSEYDVDQALNEYSSKVSNILEKIIQAYEGNVDKQFWKNIVVHQKCSKDDISTQKMSGWLMHLFGFYGSVGQVPLGQIRLEIDIDHIKTSCKKSVRLVGGFKAVSCERGVFRPHLSFAIEERKACKSLFSLRT